MLDRQSQELSLRLQTRLLNLNRSSLYYQPVAPSAGEVALKHRIDELYTGYPCYGVRRITATRRREAKLVNHAVRRHMREMGRRTSYPSEHRYGPNSGICGEERNCDTEHGYQELLNRRRFLRR